MPRMRVDIESKEQGLMVLFQPQEHIGGRWDQTFGSKKNIHTGRALKNSLRAPLPASPG